MCSHHKEELQWRKFKINQATKSKVYIWLPYMRVLKTREKFPESKSLSRFIETQICKCAWWIIAKNSLRPWLIKWWILTQEKLVDKTNLNSKISRHSLFKWFWAVIGCFKFERYWWGLIFVYLVNWLWGVVSCRARGSGWARSVSGNASPVYRYQIIPPTFLLTNYLQGFI